jgi:hypothetical protein
MVHELSPGPGGVPRMRKIGRGCPPTSVFLGAGEAVTQCDAGSHLDCWLVDARDVKNVPGRPKTDGADAVWLAKVAERGMCRLVQPRPSASYGI